MATWINGQPVVCAKPVDAVKRSRLLVTFIGSNGMGIIEVVDDQGKPLPGTNGVYFFDPDTFNEAMAACRWYVDNNGKPVASHPIRHGW